MSKVRAWQVDISELDAHELECLKTKIDKRLSFMESSNFTEGKITCKTTYNNKYELFLGVEGFRNNVPSISNKSIFLSENIEELINFVDELSKDLQETKKRLVEVQEKRNDAE